MNAPIFNAPAVVSEDGMTSIAMLSDDKVMDRMIRFAEIMASGKATIPNELRNVGDCLAITMQAANWKMNPFSVAQKMFFISGKIGYEAQLVAAAINNSGAVKDTFHFEWYGPWEKVVGKFDIRKSTKDGKTSEYRVPGWELKDEEGIGIRVWATLKNENEPRVLDLLLAQARTRNSTLWADDPRQQLAYLGQKRWARLYCPGVILGVYTPDELHTVPEYEINPMQEASPSNGRPPIDQAKEFYPQDKFATNLPKWSAMIASGEKTADQIIRTVQSKNPLTDEQLQAIRAVKKDEPQQAPSISFAQVAQRLNAAKDSDELDAAADFIRDVSSEEQRAELCEIYTARQTTFAGE